MATYLVRLASSTDLYVSLARDPIVYRLNLQTGVLNRSWERPSDAEALLGTTNPATVGDLRAGRAKDIAFETFAYVVRAKQVYEGADYELYLDQENIGGLETHADAIYDTLLRISGPVYGIRVEDMERPGFFPGRDANILVSPALFRVLNPVVPISDRDTAYVVSQKALSEWKPY